MELLSAVAKLCTSQRCNLAKHFFGGHIVDAREIQGNIAISWDKKANLILSCVNKRSRISKEKAYLHALVFMYEGRMCFNGIHCNQAIDKMPSTRKDIVVPMHSLTHYCKDN